MVPADFKLIADLVDSIARGIFAVGSSVVVLLIMVCGMFIMVDRNTSIVGRMERFGWLKNVLIGYVILVTPSFIVGLFLHLLIAVHILAGTP